MLNFSATRQTGSIERPVAAGFQITAEGQALVMDLANGGVRPSAGVAGEKFVGFAIATQINPEFTAWKESVVVDADGKATLSAKPVASTALVKNAATGAVIAIDGTTVTLSANVISGLTAGITVDVIYTRALTVTEAKALQGDILPGGAAANAIGAVGVIYDGDVYTDQFDTSVDWAAATAVKLGADGKLTTTGSGVTLTNVTIVALPGDGGQSFLGLHVNA